MTTRPMASASDRPPVDAATLRLAEKSFGYFTYLIATFVGACMLCLPPERFGSTNWSIAFRLFPGGSTTWGIVYLVAGVVGLLVVRGPDYTRQVDLVCCTLLGFWSFLNGSYFWASFFSEPTGGPTGPALFWLFATVFLARGVLNLKALSP